MEIQYLFLSSNLSHPENGVYRRLRRINRETKTQLISNSQRFAHKIGTTPDGGNEFDWSRFSHTERTASRFRKNKLFDENGNLTDHYGSEIHAIKDDLTPMQSDTPFDEMFHIVKGNSREELLFGGLDGDDRNIMQKIFGKPKRNTHAVCLDAKDPIGKHLKETFEVDVYVVDRMWSWDSREHWTFGDFNKDNVYNRNCIFHQVTVFGNDKKVISKEENQKNNPIIMWVFEDKIIYKIDRSLSTW